MATPLIVVVGSVNMDLVVRVPAFPVPGETVMGGDLMCVPGGKGANQAVAAAKLGANCHLVGRVGADDFGQRLMTSLESFGVSTTFVTVTEGVSSGTASIHVNATTGENAIVVSPGANARLTPDDVDRALPLIRTAHAVIVQLEIPLATVLHVISVCNRHRIPVILDPAPVVGGGKGLPAELFNVTVLTPNQTEAAELLGIGDLRNNRAKAVDPKQIAVDLLGRGPASVVLKLGDQGSLYASRVAAETFLHVPAFKVKVKDTTAAGDAFTAGLAVARAEGRPTAEALRFANAAGALACTEVGAQPSLPSRLDVDDVIRRWA